MKRIETYGELTALTSAELHAGVLTNAFTDAETYGREISDGRLFAEKTENGLLILHDRGSHFRLNFYLHSAEIPDLELDRPIVTEIAYRQIDKRVAELVPLFAGSGFSHKFDRVRLCRKTSEIVESDGVRLAEPCDAVKIQALLAECFDPLTGCLPTDTELDGIIKNGELLVTEDGAGVLHFADGKTTEIRHLAVSPSARKQGTASRLIASFLSKTENKKSRVWVTSGNTAAEKTYEKNGYLPDGWTSSVLIK